jgi:hypothetical protein
MPVRPVLVGPTELRDAIGRLYHRTGPRTSEPGGFTETLLEPGDTAPVIAPLFEEGDARPAPPMPLPPPGAPATPARLAAPIAAPAAAVPSAPPASVTPKPAVTAPTSPTSPARSALAKPRDVPTRTILRALTRLLVEKGVITRDELLEQVRNADAAKDRDDPQA